MPTGTMARLGAGFIAFAAALASTGAAGQELFFKGKEINLIIGVPPGGGYDLYARLLARHWGKHIPGNPVVVPRNMDGAGAKIAANHIYNVAPKDGLHIAAVVNGMPFEPLFEDRKFQFDPVKFSWIGNINKEVNLLVFWHQAPVETMKDVIEKELIVAASSGAGSSNTLPRILNELIGTKLKVVAGYKSSAEGFLSMERGETHGRGMYWSSLMAAQMDLYKAGKLRIVLQVGLSKHPDLPNVPFVLDYARTPEDRKLMELLFASLTIGRPVLAPPGMPPDRLATLRRAFDAALADPALKAEADKQRMEVVPMTGEEVEKVIVDQYASSPTLVARARKMEMQ